MTDCQCGPVEHSCLNPLARVGHLVEHGRAADRGVLEKVIGLGNLCRTVVTNQS